MDDINEKDVQNLISILVGFCETEKSRLKIEVTRTGQPESVVHRYHHGRCDIGSPWARGTAFDVLE